MRLTRHVSALVLTAVVAAGCSIGGTSSVSKDEIEEQVSSELADQTGETPESLTCDDDLEAEVDAEIRCTVDAADGSDIGVTVTATEVDGNDVTYEYQVDDQPGN